MQSYLLTSAYGAIILLILAITFFIIYWQHPSLKSALLWAISYLSFTIALTLSFTRAFIFHDSIFLILTLNTFAFLTMLLDFWAVSIWVKRNPLIYPSIIFTVMFMLAHFYFTAIDPNIQPRIVIVRLYYFLVSFFCLYQIQSSFISRNIGHHLAAFFLFLHGVTHAIAISTFLIFDFQSNGSLNTNEYFNLVSTQIVFGSIPITFLGTGIFYLLGLLLDILENEKDNAQIDTVTRVLNRRGFEKTLQQEIKLGQRHEQPLTLILVAIDDFKNVQRNINHYQRDQLLMEFCQHLQFHLRDTDHICHLEAEAFFILLPSANLQNSLNTIKRMQEDLRLIMFKAIEPAIKLNASFSLCQIDVENDTFEKLYEKLDERLKQAIENESEVIVTAESTYKPVT